MHLIKTIKKNDILKEPSLIPAGYAVAICYEYGGSWTHDTSVKHGNANHLCHSQHTKTRHHYNQKIKQTSKEHQ